MLPKVRRAWSTGMVSSRVQGDGPRARWFQSLLDPGTYPHHPRRVRLVQTHASWVFLAPPFVYKVKKPVDFGFLDFSTLAKRRRCCEREVELNRRLAPDLYLGVVPIWQRDGHGVLGPEGAVDHAAVEYAVKLRYLAPENFLDHRLRRGTVTRADIERIVQTLKPLYVGPSPPPEVEEWGRIGQLRFSTDENFRQVRPFVGSTLSLASFEAIEHFTARYFQHEAPTFADRVRQGRIRDCHGDLHCEHVHLTTRAVRIYDCIEFNDRFRYIDVASDVAFLAMDLDFEGRPDLARYFVHRMAAELGDPGMLRLMDFYQCYRAFVRGKVESLHSQSASAPAEEQEASAERARRYFQLALRYAVAGSRPCVLAVMGRAASGKSTLAGALRTELGWSVVSSDVVRKTLADVPLRRRGNAVQRRRLYGRSMTDRTYRELAAAAARQVARGRSLILDATFARRQHRAQLVRAVNLWPADWRFVHVQASDEAIRRRLVAREKLPGVVSDARLSDWPRLMTRFEVPAELPVNRRVVVRTSGAIVDTVRLALRRCIAARFTTRTTKSAESQKPNPADRPKRVRVVAASGRARAVAGH